MNDKLSDQVSQLLDKFGGNAERVWPAMVQATQFDSTVKTACGVVLTLIGLGLIGWAFRLDDDPRFLAIGAGTCSLVFGILLVLLYVTGVFYPESVLVARLLSK